LETSHFLVTNTYRRFRCTYLRAPYDCSDEQIFIFVCLISIKMSLMCMQYVYISAMILGSLNIHLFNNDCASTYQLFGWPKIQSTLGIFRVGIQSWKRWWLTIYTLNGNKATPLRFIEKSAPGFYILSMQTKRDSDIVFYLVCSELLLLSFSSSYNELAIK